MSEPATQDFTNCPHWGHGGRYVVDPETGQRVPVITGESVSPGTGEVMTAVEGNTLASEKPAKKGK